MMTDLLLSIYFYAQSSPGLNTSSIMFGPFECKVVIRAGSLGTRTEQDTGRQAEAEVKIDF